MAVIYGTNAADTLLGTAGDDQIRGYAGDDVLNGGAGNDVLMGGEGADQINGGSGVDIASYEDVTNVISVTLNLKTGVHTGAAKGDTFTDIEVFRGTNWADTFVSGSGADTFDGLQGNDTLSYATSDQAINIFSSVGAAGTGTGGDAQGDSFTNVETIVGSAFNDTFTLTGGGLTLNGGAGNDVYIINGNTNASIIEAAGGGDDEVRTTQNTAYLAVNVERLTFTGTGNFKGVGNAGDNVITGGAGDDVLTGGAGADQLSGGAGFDIASYEEVVNGVPVTLNLKTGVNTGIALGDSYFGIELYKGTNYGDTFVSGAAADNFDGLQGADTLSYSTSDQAVHILSSVGGAGTGTGGDAQGDSFTNVETIVGSAFNDTFTLTGGGLTLNGGAGNDVYIISGNTNAGIIEVAGGGDDEVRTTQNTAYLAANVERLTFTGGGNFKGTGNAGDNIITGGAGDDVLIGGAGADQLNGGAGFDTASYEDVVNGVGVTLNLKTGSNTGIALGDSYSGIELYKGTNYTDTFVSGAAADAFDGLQGSDTLDYSTSAEAINILSSIAGAGTGSGGDAQGDSFTNVETIVGTVFNDTFTLTGGGLVLNGGAGDDVYVLNNNANGVIIETAGGGIDQLFTNKVDMTLAANVERLTYTGTGNFTGRGNAGDNVITGGSGNDVLIGGAGADQLIGGAGLDTASYEDERTGAGVTLNLKTGVHTGMAQGDTFESIEAIRGSAYGDTFFAGTGADTLDGAGGLDKLDYADSSQAISLSIANGAGTGSGGDAQGDQFSNMEWIGGSAYADRFSATAGTITVSGGAGDDVYVVDASGVINAIEVAGGGDDEIRTSQASGVLGAEIERLTYTGSGNFTGRGNASDNVITGGVGNDVLMGGAGADQFIGGSGIDTVSYEDDPTKAGVTVDLKNGVHTGIAAGDTFSGIEGFRGSANGDTFVASLAVDTLDGAGGIDKLDYSSSAQAITLSITNGGGVGVGGDAQGDVFSNFENIIGTAQDDQFTLAAGSMTFAGGAGNDVYIVNGTGALTVIETVDGGYDEVRTSQASATLSAGVERLTYTGTGTGNFTGRGNASDNVITGGSGNDVLMGGGGADQLIGGAGSDTVSYEDDYSGVGVTLNFKTGVHTGIAAGDTFSGIETFRGSSSNDTFVASVQADVFDGAGGTADKLDYSGSAQGVVLTVANNAGSGVGGDAQGDVFSNFENIVGTALDDQFTVTASTMNFTGGLGNDVYFATGTGSVLVTELAGEGDDEVRTNQVSYTLNAEVERLTYTGTGNFTGHGNVGDNIITGGAGNDVLFGGLGADQLIGGAGFDIASYADGGMAIVSTKTGVANGGSAAGDTYSSIEQINGSNAGDIFIGGAGADRFDGGAGVDFLSFAYETEGVTFNLGAPPLTGVGAGDVYTSIEAFLGSNYADTFTGSTAAAESFVGGGGADVLFGVGRGDAAWYVNSSAAVQVNLLTGAGIGGDAEGDVLSNIDNLVGSAFSDTLTGNALANMIEGGDGNDIIDGGDGNDILYGNSFTITGALTGQPATDNQADIIHGGNGNDYIAGYVLDAGSLYYGDGGNDRITVVSAIADGGDGDDELIAIGNGYELHGGAGNDKLYLSASGDGYGGEGSDQYFVASKTMVAIFDDGVTGTDTVTLRNIQTFNDVVLKSNDLGVYIFNRADVESGNLNSGVFLKDWNAGANNIEKFYTNNGESFTIPVVGQAMTESFAV